MKVHDRLPEIEREFRGMIERPRHSDHLPLCEIDCSLR